MGKPEAKRPLGRPPCRWEDSIKMDRREIEWSGMDWTSMSQDRDKWKALVNTGMNLQVPWNVWKFLAEWQATCQEGLVSNLRILDYQAQIWSGIMSEIGQQSWCQVAAYNAANQISDLKLHKSLRRNVTSVHPCGFWLNFRTHERSQVLKVNVKLFKCLWW
jgi:hypothetical protein